VIYLIVQKDSPDNIWGAWPTREAAEAVLQGEALGFLMEIVPIEMND
jgi:hypothetical protein